MFSVVEISAVIVAIAAIATSMKTLWPYIRGTWAWLTHKDIYEKLGMFYAELAILRDTLIEKGIIQDE